MSISEIFPYVNNNNSYYLSYYYFILNFYESVDVMHYINSFYLYLSFISDFLGKITSFRFAKFNNSGSESLGGKKRRIPHDQTA